MSSDRIGRRFDRGVRHRTELLLVVSAAVVLAVSALPAQHDQVSTAERTAFQSINRLPGFLYGPLMVVMQLGNVVTIFVVAIIAGLFHRYRHRHPVVAPVLRGRRLDGRNHHCHRHPRRHHPPLSCTPSAARGAANNQITTKRATPRAAAGDTDIATASYIVCQGVKSCTGPPAVNCARSCALSFTKDLAGHRSRGRDRVHQVARGSRRAR